jgi:hypothetical protein
MGGTKYMYNGISLQITDKMSKDRFEIEATYPKGDSILFK